MSVHKGFLSPTLLLEWFVYMGGGAFVSMCGPLIAHFRAVRRVCAKQPKSYVSRALRGLVFFRRIHHFTYDSPGRGFSSLSSG